MIDEKFDSLMAELKREEAIKTEAVGRTGDEFEMTVNSLAGQLKALDGDNEKALRGFAEGFKNEAAGIFETIKAENDSIETSEVRVHGLIREVVDKSAADLVIEKRDREATEEVLVAMLENTCLKIQRLNN